MKYLKTYDSYKDSNTNEGLGEVFRSAKGAMKNFLGGLLTPFKNIVSDFKKGMRLEDIKKEMGTSLDTMLKNATSGIQKAKDESEINQMTDAFMKELDEKLAEFDKEISTIKESKIYEGAIQDAMIGGRVLFGILKDEYNRQKIEFDKKYAEAKDLNTKKQVGISRLKSIVDGYKKKVSNEVVVKAATDKYKIDHKITAKQVDPNILKSYEVTKFEELVGKEVSYKREDYINGKDPEDQKDMIAKGDVKKVEGDKITIFNKNINKEIVKSTSDIIAKEGVLSTNPEESIKKQLTDIKTQPEKMKKISEILPGIISNIDDEEKIKTIEDTLK